MVYEVYFFAGVDSGNHTIRQGFVFTISNPLALRHPGPATPASLKHRKHM